MAKKKDMNTDKFAINWQTGKISLEFHFSSSLLLWCSP